MISVLVTVAVVRIYGTDDQYGPAPRARPPGAPLVFRDYPNAGESLMVDLGAVPDDIASAERGRRALGMTMIRGLVGEGAGTSPDEKFDAAVGDLGGEELFGDSNWLVTFALKRQIDVDLGEFSDAKFVFWREAFVGDDEFVSYARPHLDLAAAIASTIIDLGSFQTLVMPDRVLLFAPEKIAAGVPVLTASGVTARVTRGKDSLRNLSARLGLMAQLDAAALRGQEWLARVAHWRMQALTEIDPWKRFLWSFIALEILTHKLFDRLGREVVADLRVVPGGAVVEHDLPIAEIVWSDDRMPLRARFALVSIALFPEMATDDLTTFVLALDARNRLSHGSLRDEAELPTTATSELLDRYVRGVFMKIVLDLPGTTSWDEAVAAHGGA